MIHIKNKELFCKLYEENQKLVRNIIFNMAGEMALEDLTQEVFLKIWKGLSYFNFKSSIRTWIYRVSVNVAVDYLRSRKMKTEELSEDKHSADNEDRDIGLSNKKIVQSALMELDDVHRSVIVLFYFEELDIKQIAKILNTAEGTVKSRLHFAKHKLKAFLEKQGVTL
jgi:RNA polymerase sigma-70 factor, ECF subfamily